MARRFSETVSLIECPSSQGLTFQVKADPTVYALPKCTDSLNFMYR